jgi:hypothetical protein
MRDVGPEEGSFEENKAGSIEFLESAAEVTDKLLLERRGYRWEGVSPPFGGGHSFFLCRARFTGCRLHHPGRPQGDRASGQDYPFLRRRQP